MGTHRQHAAHVAAGVEKSFPVGAGQTFVLRRITLDIKPGEFVSIMGPSGAGKSTLLHILGMHDSAWTGEYTLMGQPIHALPAKERAALQKRHIGFVFQSYHLLDNLTVYENIELPLSYRDVQEVRAAEHRRRRARSLRHRRQEGPLSRSSSRAASSSSSAWRARSSPARRSSSPTSRPATCTRRRGRRSWSSSSQLNEQGTTIVQVTHSETNAAYGSRVIRLRDGYIDTN